MKLHLLNRSSVSDRSFSVTHDSYPNFLRVWHYHPEFELVAIVQSSGTRFIGDSIDKFEEGEVVLIGSNVPHMWLNNESYFKEESNLTAEAVAVHFKKDFLGEAFLGLPEMTSVAHLLKRAERGIKFSNLSLSVVNKIRLLVGYDGVTRIYKLLEILHLLSYHENCEILSSSGFVSTFHQTENKRLYKIYEFVFENFNQRISSSDVAKVVDMNTSSFSRFFKKAHRKSFTTYLNEIRIGYACKLLITDQDSITSIAYLSGFNNISNFNRQFRAIHGQSPSAYLKNHRLKVPN